MDHRHTSSNINRICDSHSGLKYVNLNARSIVSNMDELRRMPDDTQPYVIGIIETGGGWWGVGDGGGGGGGGGRGRG